MRPNEIRTVQTIFALELVSYWAFFKKKKKKPVSYWGYFKPEISINNVHCECWKIFGPLNSNMTGTSLRIWWEHITYRIIYILYIICTCNMYVYLCIHVSNFFFFWSNMYRNIRKWDHRTNTRDIASYWGWQMKRNKRIKRQI